MERLADTINDTVGGGSNTRKGKGWLIKKVMATALPPFRPLRK